MLRLLLPKAISFDRAVATGVGIAVDTSQTQNIGIAIVGENDAMAAPAVGTVQFRGTFEHITDINLAAAASYTEPWQYVGLSEYLNGMPIDGSVGVAFNGNAVVLLKINANELKTIAAEISAYTSGKFSVFVYAVNNQ